MRRARGRQGGVGRLGQVVVEMLLILPVFLTIVFTIMDLGVLAFWVITLNHATYEVARIGALRAGPDPYPASYSGQPRDVTSIMDAKLKSMSRGNGVARLCGRGVTEPWVTTESPTSNATTFDPQAQQQNYDLVVTGNCIVRYMFPLSSQLLSSGIVCPQGPGNGTCKLSVTLRMPIEMPLKR